MKPILFNTDMVRRLLDGTKTVTRRVVKPQPICYGPNITFEPHDEDFFLSAEKNWLRCRFCGHDPEYSREGSNVAHHWEPPYHPGDILYVREKWRIVDYLDGLSLKFEYEADGKISDFIDFTNDRLKKFLKYINRKGWCPKIFMPREAARIFLRVTGVRVERLQEITEGEARREGVERSYIDSDLSVFVSARANFSELWDNTIKKADRTLYGWYVNPWVWGIEFERISKEQAREQ